MSTVAEALQAKKEELLAKGKKDVELATQAIMEPIQAEVAVIEAKLAAGGQHLLQEVSVFEEWMAKEVAAFKAWF